MYLLKDYEIVKELERLHRPSEAVDFFALHLTAFFGRFDRVFFRIFQKIFFYLFICGL